MSGTLVVQSDQSGWTDKQLAVLKQIGVQNASQGDLDIFFNYCQRTGLDPFARQIYMINRGGKWGIQASIDGLRIVAQRSGNYGGQTPTQWCGQDGVWTDVWLATTPPVAARVGVYYKDVQNPTWAVAKWDSYAVPQNPIWKKMPDLMLAKCAEALALRKAFPNDLSGIYTSEEMAQADVDKKPAEAKPVTSIPQAVQYAPEMIADAELIIKSIPEVETIDELRKIWSTESAFLDVPANGTTLKEAINVRVKELTDKLNNTEVVDAE
jgi:phage recombination protein Bet